MTRKTTDSMNETVNKYLSGEISYEEAVDIMYSIYLENVKKLQTVNKIDSKKKK